MRARTTRALLRSSAVALVVAAACGDSGGGSDGDQATATSTTAVATFAIDPGDGGDYRPAIDPSAFVATISNPYLPLSPGARWVYEGSEDGESQRIEVVVTDERRTVMGIEATVVRDTVSSGGQLVEDTYDWFAQDGDGNVWYLGEETAEYDDGEVVSRSGSWEAGVDGALPGIVMPAQPQAGQAYRQEFYPGEAEDLFEVVALDTQEAVAAGSFDGVLVTKEWTPLEPDVVEEKRYAPGVGMISETTVAGGEGRFELVTYTTGPG